MHSTEAEHFVATLAPPRQQATPPRHASFPLRLPQRAVKSTRHPSVWTRFLIDVARGGLAILALHLFVLQISVVRGHSMEPSLLDGDRLVVDRIAYAVSEVARFDVVVLRYPADPSVDFVKRVVGLPGDRVALADGRLYLNGVAADESFLHVPDHASMQELVVPEGCYFVLGDNRPISCDSREFGLVPATHMKGKVRVRFWPPARLAMF